MSKYTVFSRKGIGGYKMPPKTWDSSQIDGEMEDKRIVLVLIGLVIVMVGMAYLMFFIRKSIH